MSKAFLSVLTTGLLSLLGACSQVPSKDDAADLAGGNHKLAVGQVGRGSNAEFVFCDSSQCASRTPKVIAALPEVKREPAQAVTRAPVASKPETFTVHFRWAWSKLDNSGKQEMDAVVTALKGKSLRKVVVAGRTDPTGALQYNEKLALRRAETVAKALVVAGIPSAVIETRAQEPCCDGDLKSSPRVMQQLRRTDIDITITTK